ncbi:hypothetical protein FACS1894192_07420 [Bacilli bacterium]|nr:hypothetical protein FACS1894192_07420 [Bacilli bacterium]
MRIRVIQDFKPDANFKESQEYQVYGISIENTGSLNVLIEWGQYYGKYGKPQWFPLNDFEIIDSRIPYNWKVILINKGSEYEFLSSDYNIKSIMGYDKLVESSEHWTGLLNRNREDLDYFYENIHNQIDTID